MAENKKSFSLYTDLIKLVNGSNVHDVEVEPMTNEEAGQLFKWILEYVNDLHPVVPRDIRFAVGYVKKQLDEDLERWKKQCEINRINGALGGRPRKPKETENNRIGFQETENNRNKAKKPDKDKDIDKDIYIDKLINDKSRSACDEDVLNVNFYPITETDRQNLKKAIDIRHLDYSEFLMMHRFVKPLYFNNEFTLEECISLTDKLKEMETNYDYASIGKGWSYSLAKSKNAENRVGYIISILEKNIQSVIQNEKNKREEFNINSLKTNGGFKKL